MKHVITLISALIFLSATVKADDVKKNRKSKAVQVAAAPFVWGNPNEDAPLKLELGSAIKLKVPVAPFEWGAPEELSQVDESSKLKNTGVPVAPFVMGHPDDDISFVLQATL